MSLLNEGFHHRICKDVLLLNVNEDLLSREVTVFCIARRSAHARLKYIIVDDRSPRTLVRTFTFRMTLPTDTQPRKKTILKLPLPSLLPRPQLKRMAWRWAKRAGHELTATRSLGRLDWASESRSKSGKSKASATSWVGGPRSTRSGSTGGSHWRHSTTSAGGPRSVGARSQGS